MTKIRARGEDVRRYILENVSQASTEIAKRTATHFDISRQAVNKHLQKLTVEGSLIVKGRTRSSAYFLAPQATWRQTYTIDATLAEDVIWRKDIQPVLGALPDNVMNIWHHGFTEMLNNAIDHSEGKNIWVSIDKTAVDADMIIHDDGVGIFKKIKSKLDLLDERHAVLELAKGKLTTDPKRHSGEGIFFTSRMFDSFDIISGGVHFGHKFGKNEDWILERERPGGGTSVLMRLNNHTARTTKKIFDQFSAGAEYQFNKTVVPVRLAQYGNDLLVSRSQAKRLLSRVELFSARPETPIFKNIRPIFRPCNFCRDQSGTEIR